MSATMHAEPITSAQCSALRARPSAFAVVRTLLGLLLIGAAVLKLSGFGVTALPRIGWFSDPMVQLLAAEWELVLGLWLISGIYPYWSWLAAIGTFSLFAIVSGYLGWIGVASCGCFGAIKVSPWVASGVDLAALCLLVIARPPPYDASLREDSKLTRISRQIVLPLLVAISVVLIHLSYRPTISGGDLLTPFPGVLHFGTVAQSGRTEARIRFTNNSNTAIRIVRIETSCACFSIELGNALVEAGSATKATAKLNLAHEAKFAGTLLLDATGYADGENRPIAFRIEATVEVVPAP